MLRRICRVRSGEEARKLLAPFLSAYPEAILLAPTRAAADELVFTLPGSFGIHRRTLSQLAIEAAAAELASRGLTPIAGLTAEALASRAIHELRRQKRLTYFDPVADTPGFPQAAARTIRELRLQRISPTKLSRAGASERDLGLMLRAWSSLLEEFSLADEAVVFDLAAGAKDSPLLGLPLLALDAAIRNRSEIAFLRAILERSSTVIATVSEGDLESESAWRTLLGVPSEESATEPATQLEALRTRLFVSTSAATLTDSSVDFFSSPGESSECVEIARRVHALAREGVRLDGIAILLRQPERYQPLVEDALRRAGITAWFSRGVRRPDPAGRAFLTLLKCGEEGLSASRFAEYLSLAQIPLKNAAEEFQAPTDEIGAMLLGTGEEEWSTVEPERTPPAPANWERMLVDAAVIGGADRWKRRLDGLAAELQLRLDAIGDDNGDRTLVSRQLDQLEQLRTFALPLIGELDSLPKAAKWDEWLPRLQALARFALRNPYGVLALLAELEPLTAVGPVSLAEVAEVLTPHLSTLRLEPPKRRFGSVLVAGIEEARGRVFDAAFVPGLAEGIFPQRIREDPLLLDVRCCRWPPGLRAVWCSLTPRWTWGSAADVSRRSMPSKWSAPPAERSAASMSLSAVGERRQAPAWDGPRLKIRVTPSTIPNTTSPFLPTSGTTRQPLKFAESFRFCSRIPTPLVRCAPATGVGKCGPGLFPMVFSM
jgi:ATP-dependent helicase/nuclease subunit B